MRHRMCVLPLAVCFLVVLAVGMAVIMVVALPRVRRGAPVLTDRGERLTLQAVDRAAALAHGAAEVVTEVVSGVGRRTKASAGRPPTRPVDGQRPDPSRPGQVRTATGPARPAPQQPGRPARQGETARPVDAGRAGEQGTGR